MGLSGHADIKYKNAECCHIPGYKKLPAKYNRVVDLDSSLVHLGT